jgi:hypothetical protein
MPYSPPAGLAVNFVRDQAAYSPPPGEHVDFHGYTEASYVLTGNGKVRFDGGMGTYSAPVGLGGGVLALIGEMVTGVGTAAALAGEFAFLGAIDTEAVIPTITAEGQINWGDSISVTVVVNSVCTGEIMWDGEIDLFTRPPQIDVECYGVLPAFSGGAAVRRGNNSVGGGRVTLGGSAAARSGRNSTMSGKLAFGGVMHARRGAAAHLGGTVAFSGEISGGVSSTVTCSLNGALKLSGSTAGIVPQELIQDSVFIVSRQEKAYVFE